jgi:hypothetical protein
VSSRPCIIAVGHLTWFAAVRLSNLSSTNKSANLPAIFLAILLTDFIGLIKIKHLTSNFEAKWNAGPDPILLPLTIMFKLSILNLSIINL